MEDTDRKHVISHVSALNVTSTLDDVLKPRKYDRRLRPGFKRNDFSIPSKFKEDYALVV